MFYVCVAFEIGRRRLFPTENRPKTVQIIEIHIFIVLLPWIRPQAPFSDCKNMQNHEHHKKFFKIFTECIFMQFHWKSIELIKCNAIL